MFPVNLNEINVEGGATVGLGIDPPNRTRASLSGTSLAFRATPDTPDGNSKPKIKTYQWL